MSTLLDGTSTTAALSLWIGVAALTTVAFSIIKTMRLTSWWMHKPVQDMTAQHMLSRSMGIAFLNVVIPAAILAGHWMFIRPDTIDTWISYAQWALWPLAFAVLARMMAIFLTHNAEHIEFVFYVAGFSGLMLLATSYVNTFQGAYFSFHIISLVYFLHELWIYRRRTDTHAVFLLIWTSFFLPFGFSLPFFLGHAYLQIIGFEGEVWWYLVGGVTMGLVVPCIYMCYNVYRIGTDIEGPLMRSVKGMGRKSHGFSLPGWDLWGHLNEDVTNTVDAAAGYRPTSSSSV
jgi:hypothetical protein